MTKTLIKNGIVIPMLNSPQDPGDYYYTGEVAVEESSIFHVGPSGTTPDNWQPDTVIDAGGMAVLPGLINCHTHAAMTLLRGYADDLPLMQWLEEKIWPLEAKLTADDIYWGSMLSIIEMLRSGTTTFADMYFEMDKVAEAVRQTGIRAVLARGLIGVQDNAQQALAENKRLVEDWQGAAGGRITVRFGPHAPYTCPPQFLKEIIREAKDLNVGIHIHLSETLSEVTDIVKQYGKRPVELMEETGLFELPVLAAHCVHVNEKEISILESYGAGVAHNPESNMKLASGIAPLPYMISQGLKVGLGTDGAASNNNLDLLEEARSAALLHKVHTMDPTVISSYQALYLATRGGAEALGIADRTGSLEKGKKADIVLVDMQKPHLCPRHDVLAHLVYAARAEDIHTVMVDGRVLVLNGIVQGVDIKEIMEQVEKSAARLTS